MVTWDNSYQYQNICVIAHKNKREEFRQWALLILFVWTTCFGRSCRLPVLFCTYIDWTEQALSSLDRDVYKIFIIGIWRIYPSFSTAVWNIWSRKWTFSMGKRKTPFQWVVFQISRPFIFGYLAVVRFLKPGFKEILNNLYVCEAATYVE